MYFVIAGIEGVMMVLGSLAIASILCWSTWIGCARVKCPGASGLIIANFAAAGLIFIPHGSFLTLTLAYSAAAAFPIWMAGRATQQQSWANAANLSIVA